MTPLWHIEGTVNSPQTYGIEAWVAARTLAEASAVSEPALLAALRREREHYDFPADTGVTVTSITRSEIELWTA